LAFFEDMGLIQSKSALLKEQLGEQNYALLQRIQVISQQLGVMTRIPYEMKID
jgi:protease-4